MILLCSLTCVYVGMRLLNCYVHRRYNEISVRGFACLIVLCVDVNSLLCTPGIHQCESALSCSPLHTVGS